MDLFEPGEHLYDQKSACHNFSDIYYRWFSPDIFNVLLPCVIHIHVEHHIKWSHARARQGRNVKLGLIVQGGWALKLFGGGGMYSPFLLMLAISNCLFFVLFLNLMF